MQSERVGEITLQGRQERLMGGRMERLGGSAVQISARARRGWPCPAPGEFVTTRNLPAGL